MLPIPLLSSLPFRDEENKVQGHLAVIKLELRILAPPLGSFPGAFCMRGVVFPPLPVVNGLGLPGPSRISGIGFLGSGNGTEMLHDVLRARK